MQIESPNIFLTSLKFFFAFENLFKHFIKDINHRFENYVFLFDLKKNAIIFFFGKGISWKNPIQI